MKDLEIPLGKRTRLYRAFEVLPAILSYGMIILLVVLSIISPLIAAVYLLLLIITMVVKAVGIAVDSIIGHRRLVYAQSVDWGARLAELQDPAASYARFGSRRSRHFADRVHQENLRLMTDQPENFPLPSEIYNAVVIAAYNEPFEVIEPTVKMLLESTYDARRMIVVFAYEQRGGADIKETAQKLRELYGRKFKAFLVVEHPDGLPDEVIGKGANITYAGYELQKWLETRDIAQDKVIVTTLDCDNKPHKSYFDYVTYEYIVHEDRRHLSYQPIALYFSNIWDAPALMRLIAIGNSFWTIVSSTRPHMLRNFAAHSQPMDALVDMNFWSKRTIVEDGHQYWRSYFYFAGNYSVMPIYVPVYQDAVMASSFKTTLIAQFKQLRRWGYGVSDIPYVATHLFTRQRNVPFFAGLARFIRLVDSHATLATIAILVAIGGWIPLLISPESARDIAAHNLPEVLSYLQRAAMIGIFITVVLSLRLLPPRPAHYKRTRTLGMVLQWFLIPVTSIGYSAAASLTAQTHLALGKYLDKFDVTEKTKTK